jgi:hypothetical protein
VLSSFELTKQHELNKRLSNLNNKTIEELEQLSKELDEIINELEKSIRNNNVTDT